MFSIKLQELINNTHELGYFKDDVKALGELFPSQFTDDNLYIIKTLTRLVMLYPGLIIDFIKKHQVTLLSETHFNETVQDFIFKAARNFSYWANQPDNSAEEGRSREDYRVMLQCLALNLPHSINNQIHSSYRTNLIIEAVDSCLKILQDDKLSDLFVVCFVQTIAVKHKNLADDILQLDDSSLEPFQKMIKNLKRYFCNSTLITPMHTSTDTPPRRSSNSGINKKNKLN